MCEVIFDLWALEFLGKMDKKLAKRIRDNFLYTIVRYH